MLAGWWSGGGGKVHPPGSPIHHLVKVDAGGTGGSGYPSNRGGGGGGGAGGAGQDLVKVIMQEPAVGPGQVVVKLIAGPDGCNWW